MPIQFRCPDCKKVYRARDEDAGKRLKCTAEGCGRVFAVPRPQPGPAAGRAQAEQAAQTREAEKLATELLQDEPAGEEAEDELFTFRCPACDEEHEVSVAKAGKNMVCPETRNIVRVPAREKKGPIDWRQASKRPSLAKPDEAGAEEGVWSTGDRTVASTAALQEAGVLPTRRREREPLTAREWANRIAVVGLVLAAAGGAGYYGWSAMNERSRAALMAEAVGAAKEVRAAGPEWAAALHTAAGQYGLADAAEEKQFQAAQAEFNEALAALRSAGPSAAFDDRVISLAEAQVGLAGSEDQVRRKIRVNWDQAQAQMRRTFELLEKASPSARAEAVGRVAQLMLPAGESARAADLAGRLGQIPPAERADLVARVGVVLFRAGNQDGAKDLVVRAQGLLAAGGEGAGISPTLTALRAALNLPAPPQPEKARPDPAGEAAALAAAQALKGEADRAAATASALEDPGLRFSALLRAADLSGEKPAASLLEAAAALLAGDLKGEPPAPWDGVALARLCVTAGRPDLAEKVVGALPEPVKPWARLTRLRMRAESEPSAALTSAEAEAVGGEGELAAALARGLVARHNARAGHESADPETLPSRQRPFALAGEARGLLARDAE